MKTTNWTRVLVIGSISLVVLALVLNLFAPLLWQQFGGWGYSNPAGYASWRMMHGGGGPGMMGYHSFWGPGMFIGWLFPLGLLALLIAGVVWLVQTVTRSSTPLTPPPAGTCPQCGQPTQANWRNCPYCGTPLVEVQSA